LVHEEGKTQQKEENKLSRYAHKKMMMLMATSMNLLLLMTIYTSLYRYG
jgi:hypothetical protein